MRPDYTPKVPWTIGQFYKRIREVQQEMKEISMTINYLESMVRRYKHLKKSSSLQYSKKDKYLKLLKQDLEELKSKNGTV